MTQWSPESWRKRPACQQPEWPDEAGVSAAIQRLKVRPPLVSSGEVLGLREQLASAVEGKRFVLQGGDCAERLEDCTTLSVMRRLKILLQMSLVLTYGARLPVIRIGRIAGQYAKPRSKNTETIDDIEMPSYRGDAVNDLKAELEKRQPDPGRLEQCYFAACATLNYVRALLEGGFADLRRPEEWRLDFIPDSGVHAGFLEIADRIRDSLDYLDSLHGVGDSVRKVEFYTSHEALILPYEEAMTRRRDEGYFNLGAHFLWIGDRTRQLDGAHVEYMRGIRNPIGIKVGPGASSDDIRRLLDVLDPLGSPGRITLITRYGSDKVAKYLGLLIRDIKIHGHPVLWSCDPMHGNTESVNGLKTRRFENIAAELKLAFEVHRSEGSRLGAVHFELTGEDVTECIGGVENLSATDLQHMYNTGCDPRLNYSQSMEMAFIIASMLEEDSNKRRRRGNVTGMPPV